MPLSFIERMSFSVMAFSWAISSRQASDDVVSRLVVRGDALLSDLATLVGELHGVGTLAFGVLDGDVAVALGLLHDILELAAVETEKSSPARAEWCRRCRRARSAARPGRACSFSGRSCERRARTSLLAFLSCARVWDAWFMEGPSLLFLSLSGNYRTRRTPEVDYPQIFTE